MTIKECYDAMGDNYESVLQRFGTEALVERFALKFLNEKSYQNLKDCYTAGNIDEAFRAAHTLKGVCLNLGFDSVFEPSSQITEILRTGTLDGCDKYFPDLDEKYNKLIELLEQFESCKN